MADLCFYELGRKKAHPVTVSGGAQHGRCEAMTYRARCSHTGRFAFVLPSRILSVCRVHAARGERQRYLEVIR